MKKKIFKSLLAIACLLSSTGVSAYDFEVDGIYYNVVSLSELTCEITYGDNDYQGDLVIPTTVDYANKAFTVVGVAEEAFKYCNLTSITIPNTITSIGNYAFNGCYNLEYVTIEDGNASLQLGYNTMFSAPLYGGRGLFSDCRITTLYIGRNLSYYTPVTSFSPFSNNNYIKDVTISDSVTRISSDLFSKCKSIINITIPNSVTDIGHGAFSSCSGLTSVTIGNNVTEIGSSVFWECSNLTSVILGSSVSTISVGVFKGCDNLTELYSLNTTPPNCVDPDFTNKQYMTLNVYVPQESLAAYQDAEPWKNFWNLQEIEATGIAKTVNDGQTSKETKRYDATGREINSLQKGLNIIKMSDGTTKKVIVK